MSPHQHGPSFCLSVTLISEVVNNERHGEEKDGNGGSPYIGDDSNDRKQNYSVGCYLSQWSPNY